MPPDTTRHLVIGALIIGIGSATVFGVAVPAQAQLSMRSVQSAFAASPDTIEATIRNADARPIGTIYLAPDSAGVRIWAEMTDLPPGEHGLHIHAVGECDAPDFGSAGPHYSPDNRSHGFLDPAGPHAGDMPMLDANADGETRGYDFTTSHVRLDETSLLDADGSAFVVHAQPDDYRTGTGGGTGPRIACGVISSAR